MNRGEVIHKWISNRLSEGKSVFIQTALRTWKVSSKHKDMLRVRGEHCELQCGKRWDSINYCKITAQ